MTTTTTAELETIPFGQVVANQGINYEEDANLGNEQVGADNVSMPFFSILQALSPQVQDGDPKFVDGARPGMVLNSVTNEVFEARSTINNKPSTEGLVFVDCYFAEKVVVWGPNRSGWKASHDLNSPAYKAVMAENLRDGKGKLIDTEGNLWEDTDYHLGYAPQQGGYGVIGMKGSNAKPSRNWNSAIDAIRKTNSKGQKFKPARFSQLWLLQTKVQPFNEGSCFVWVHKHFGEVVDINDYTDMKNFSLDAAAGKIKLVKPPVEELQQQQQEEDVAF